MTKLVAFKSFDAAQRAGEQLLDFVARAQTVKDNTLGGFLVTEEWANAIADVRDEVGVARKIAQVVPMSTVTLAYPRYYTAATVAYEPEATAPSDTTALTDLVMLNAKKIMALVKASSEISEDAPLFADFIASAIGYALETAVDKAFFQGDGSSTYYGIQGISSATVFPASATGWVAAASGHSALSSIDNTDIATLISTLPSAFHDDAVFVMHPVVWGQLCVRLSATAGEPLGDTVPTRWFNGYRVVLAPQMPSGTSSLGGKTVMAFGNFKRGSMLGMRRDTRIAYSPSRYFDTDQIGISGTTRFDVVHHGLGDSSNAGAVVALKATT